jgi:pyruvate/2-oxoglutarate/acetoin dehydrogenase E1 component/TPP-dependent pyruvate/acetoin dehydrogenase alpha subunit
MRLLDFLALECPFLLPEGREILEQKRPPSQALADLRKAVERRLGPPGPEASSQPYPGTTAGEQVELMRRRVLDLLEGYFRRQELQASLPPEARRNMFRVMVLSRTLDTLLKKLFQEKTGVWEGFPSPQKGFRALGQEAAVGLAFALRDERDVVCPLIRGLPVLLMRLDDPLGVVLTQWGKKGTSMDGRDLHWGDLSRGVLPPTAPLAIGTQTLVGMAYAAKLRREPRVFLSIMGEGGTSLGEWHEAVTFAAAQRLSVVFVVENNHWALGTHWREQTAADRFAPKATGYGLPGITLFGNDPDEIAAASLWAAERARSGMGPSLIELVTYRRAGHAHHDDDRFHGGAGLPGYEYEEERRLWEAADPIALYESRLLAEGILDRETIAEVRAQAARRVEEAGRAAESAPWPTWEDQSDRSYAKRSDPPPLAPPARSRPMAYDEAIRQALFEALEQDARVLVLGEDVGGRYGGAFGVTRGLAKEFGPGRCLNTVLAESAIVGCAVGAALEGMRPVVEIQFADFVACGFNALVNNAAKIHWRYGRPVPMVVRLPYGGATGTGARLLGGGPFHSQCPEAWFLRVPGLKLVAPSTPADAKGLLTASIRDNNPVLFLESKGLYGIFRPDLREEVPLGDFEVPLGKAAVRRPGADLTVLTYGSMTYTALAAAEELSREGLSVEVIDLRTLFPLDEETVLGSVAKTHRALILHEDTKRGGVGAEIAALLSEKALWELDAPILRVAAPDWPAPYAPSLEHAYWPKATDVVAAIRAMLRER